MNSTLKAHATCDSACTLAHSGSESLCGACDSTRASIRGGSESWVSHANRRLLSLALSSLVLIGGFALSLSASAASVALATAPLANATTTSVLPNLMFILDNSGSMDSDFVPDWVPNNYCKGISPSTTGATSDCSDGTGNRPPFNNADYNRIYYDPSITYAVPWDASLATPANMTSYPGTGSTPMDGYGIQSTSNTTLTTGYPDLEYCTDTSYTDCLRNDNFLLPGVVSGKNYTTIHGTTASGSKSFATGTVAAPSTITRTAGPFYYVMVPGEYCSDRDQTTCIAATAPSVSHPYAAKVRWCLNSDLTNCKLVQDSSYQFVRYPTIITTAGVDAGSKGKITVSNMPRSASIGGRTRPTCVISASSSSCTAGTVADCNAQAAGGKSVVTGIKLVNPAHPAGTALLTESFTYCNGNGTGSTRNEGLAAAIQGKIGNGFTSTRSNAILEISTTDTTYGAATLNAPATWTSATLSVSTAFTAITTSVTPVAVPGSFQRFDIVSGGTYGNLLVGGVTIVDRSQRTDCVAKPDCTYAEELKNFANWYAWYRTRMQMMKTSASRAFKTIDNKYRVGFITINSASASSNYLKVNTFNSGAGNQKALWYDMLFAANPGSYTPLRGALSRVGRIFAGKNPLSVSGGDDPMQYSCQQNFALLTTDGYWNTNTETASYGPDGVTGSDVGNLDGGATARPMFEGPTAVANSLADVAKYYYDTDLRTSTFGNCTSGTSGLDVCENNVFVSSTDNNVQQHMTTFTLGLGVDGLLSFQSDYKTATSGDYYLLKNGLSKTVGGVTVPVNWPDPQVASTATEVPERIDDLWHAAVNGQGTYFSAKNPTELASGLNDALAAIGAKLGSGAAAATSTLNPVAGDNSAYVASYTTVSWTGNLESRSINIDTGVVSEAATWCVENTVAGTCTGTDAAVVASTSGSSTIYNCVTTVADATFCAAPGIYDGTVSPPKCSVELPIACTGRMTVTGVVDATSDGRTIYTKSSSGTSLVPFVIGNLNAADFSATALSQYSTLTPTQQAAASGANLVNFLRGQNGYEDRASNAAENRIYRYRSAVLADAVESQPAFIGKTTFSYTDAGYDAFKTAQAGRAGTVYMGANDGMLHAFNAATGDERWAYVPSMVIPNMWRLADKNYASLHTYYANGSPIISDICTGSCTSATDWHTILVAGLNGGGRGYYALDITVPTAPVLLWEFTTANDADLGYSFGHPVITKKVVGTTSTWVVLLTSGYNNTSPGNGEGYLYVLDAWSGTKLATNGKIATNVGDTTTPSGLGKIATWADDPEKNNTAQYTYAGDLLGNLWRFDINSGAVVKFAELKDSSGIVQPITTRPELGKIDGKRVVFVGTGKYLEVGDLDPNSTVDRNPTAGQFQQQTLYAIKDPDDYPTTTPVATLVNPRTTLAQQTLATSGATRTSSGTITDWSTGRGWYINLPDSGERQNVDSQLVLGTLIVPTTVPSNTVCAPGGYGWLNYFDYTTGQAHELSSPNIVSQKTNAPIVGVNTIFLPSGQVVTSVVTSDHPTPDKISGVGFDSLTGGFQKKRVIWREYIPE